VQDAVRRRSADIRHLAVNARVLEILSLVYGPSRLSLPNPEFPVGTQQHFHTDAVHFSSVPERFVCGVWVALEDIHEDRARSSTTPEATAPHPHERAPRYHGARNAGPYDHLCEFEEVWRELVTAWRLQRETFCPRKGQGLIWASNLLHGGDRQRDPARTRWSQVTHYFFEDCAYYTPLLSDPFLRIDLLPRGVDRHHHGNGCNQVRRARYRDDFIRYARAGLTHASERCRRVSTRRCISRPTRT